MPLRSRQLPLFSLILCASAIGCGRAALGPSECAASYNCPRDYTCSEQVCLPSARCQQGLCHEGACRSGSCPVGYSCDDTDTCQPTDVCAWGECPLCTRHQACAPGLACLEGRCTTSSCVVSGCGDGCQRCNEQSGQCENAGGECAGGLADVPARPAKECRSRIECASGYDCIGQLCFPVHCRLLGCGGGASCDETSGRCSGGSGCRPGINPSYPHCALDAECVASELCIEGRCQRLGCSPLSSACPYPSQCQLELGLCVASASCS